MVHLRQFEGRSTTLVRFEPKGRLRRWPRLKFLGLGLVLALQASSCSPSTDNLTASEPLPELYDLEIGESARIKNLWVHCGVRYIDRRINGTSWVAVVDDDSTIDWIPNSWERFVDGNEKIDLEVTLIGVELLAATPNIEVEAVEYQPTTQEIGCD